MNNQTVINPNINATTINSELRQSTVINPELPSSSTINISNGATLGGKYQLIEPLSVTTGEADLYICTYNSEEYIAKIYRRTRSIKPEVIQALKRINSPYVSSIFDSGEYNGLQFVILPFYRKGSLQGKKFSLSTLKHTIIPCLNEALHALHQNDIIHKDLKPSNIMILDDNERVAVIDFGISSVIEQGNTVLVTKTGMTPEYSAPETFRNLFLEESDYYSLGITLYELYCGHTPYQNMTTEEIAQFTAVQRIPLPKDMPKELQELISAVTYFDITNRHNKENPNRRWTYAEVKNWYSGKKQLIPGEGVEMSGGTTMPPYTFLKKGYKDIPSLTMALASNWNEGKKQLYRGLLSAFFKNFNPEVAGYCLDAEYESSQKSSNEDIIFWKLLYRIYPELNGFYWRGLVYESLPAFGRDMLEHLYKEDTSCHSQWDMILHSKLLSNYLTIIKVKNKEVVEAVSALEDAHSLSNRSRKDTLINYYLIAYLLSGEKVLRIGNDQFRTPSELIEHMKSLLVSSYKGFEAFCHTLIAPNSTLNAQFEAWLISIGKKKELDVWKRRLVI